MFIGLWICFCLSKISSFIFTKLTSNQISKKSSADFARFLIINGLCACAFFLVSGKFQIHLNSVTLLFAFIYAVIVFASLLLNVISFRLIEISNLNVIRNTGSMLINLAVGFFLFSEAVTFKNILRIVLMCVATFLIFLGKKGKSGEVKKGTGILVLGVIAVLSTVSIAASTITLKYFSIVPNTKDTNSLFFLTNAIMVVGALFYMPLLPKRSESTDKAERFTLTKLLIFLGNTVSSNVGSLLSALLIAKIDISIYSPLSTAFAILCGISASLIFKEKLKLFDWLAVLIAALTIAI